MVRGTILLATLLCIIMPSLFSKIEYTGKEKVSLIETVETRNSFVSYVKIKGRKYLVKQKKIYKHQLAPVREALAAYVAKALKIANEIYVIKSKKKFPGKKKQNWPATLHTLAGETIRKQQNCKYKALRLRQFWAQAQSFSEKGLTRAIINHTTWHKQLPVIVALDLFTGDSDRHCGNLCYNPTTDTFCAIDMDDTFNKDLCVLACKKLAFMMKNKNVIFTREEINALKVMKETLKFLVNKHKPKDLIEKLYYFAKKAGFTKGNDLYNDRIRRKLLYFEKMIRQTHKSAYELIALLDKIIKHKSVTVHNNGENNVVL